MNTTQTHTTHLYVSTCPTCHITHGFPNDMRDQMKEWGGVVYCPNGHRWEFRTDKSFKAQLEDEQRRVQNMKFQRDLHKRMAAAARGQATKLKNRIKNGVCPCCNRSFTNLRRHIANQHPDYCKDNE